MLSCTRASLNNYFFAFFCSLWKLVFSGEECHLLFSARPLEKLLTSAAIAGNGALKLINTSLGGRFLGKPVLNAQVQLGTATAPQWHPVCQIYTLQTFSSAFQNDNFRSPSKGTHLSSFILFVTVSEIMCTVKTSFLVQFCFCLCWWHRSSMASIKHSVIFLDHGRE